MRPLRNPSGPHARLSGALRALALEGTPSHGRGRRVRSLVAPREGEGRRTGWRSAAKRELHGGCDRIGQRAEAEKFFTRATALADAGLKWVQRPAPLKDLDTTRCSIAEGAHRRSGIRVNSCSDPRKGAAVSTRSAWPATAAILLQRRSRRLTLHLVRHEPCRAYGNRNLTRSVKGSCVSG